MIALGAFVGGLFPWPRLSSNISPPSIENESIAYPCQGGTCGCDSAEKCWSSCCCRSPEERRQWAIAHGVTPPEYAILSSDDRKPRACCDQAKPEASRKSRSVCCTTQRVDAPRAGCCMDRSDSKATTSTGCDGCAKNKSRVARTPLKRTWVDTLSASRCRGFGFDLNCCSAFVETDEAQWSPPSPMLERLLFRRLQYRSIALSIDPPPPKQI